MPAGVINVTLFPPPGKYPSSASGILTLLISFFIDVPGKPALFGTTKAFLDYFELTSLDDLPTLAEIKDMESLEPELDFETHHTVSDTEPDSDTDSEPDIKQSTEAEDAELESRESLQQGI